MTTPIFWKGKVPKIMCQKGKTAVKSQIQNRTVVFNGIKTNKLRKRSRIIWCDWTTPSKISNKKTKNQYSRRQAYEGNLSTYTEKNYT